MNPEFQTLQSSMPALIQGYWWDVRKDGHGALIKLRWREGKTCKAKMLPRISGDYYKFLLGLSDKERKRHLKHHVIGHHPNFILPILKALTLPHRRT